jgi:ribonuclease HII
MPDLNFEIAHGRNAGKIICGVDEVGRGPLAGPVVAAAVVIPMAGLPECLAAKINDSKKLSEKSREEIFPAITELCACSIAEASVREIDEMNILNASLLAMRRAVEGLSSKPDTALIDGNRSPTLCCPAFPIIRGDGKSLSIAAASIIAKVTRDRMMKKLAEEYPGYGWERNAGYGTAAHMEALRILGATRWHRESFAPVSKLIGVTG